MNNRRLEYNPLFESLADSARRYERIVEQSTPDKIKYAVEYARRIMETCYSQYVYFVNSVPDATVKTTLLTSLSTYLKEQKDKGLDIKTFFDGMISKMEDLVKQISGNQAIRNLENFEKLQSIYDKIEQGKNELKDVTMEEYTKQYSTEYTSPEVKKAVNDFISFSSQALDQSLPAGTAK